MRPATCGARCVRQMFTAPSGWVKAALLGKTSSGAPSGESRSAGKAGLIASTLDVDRRAFMVPLPPSARLVGRVVDRATNRKREGLADIALDKQASVVTGVITPDKAVLARDSSQSRKRPARVTPEALDSVQEAMSAHRTAAARATVQAVIGAKRRELEQESLDLESKARNKLISFAKVSVSLGVRPEKLPYEPVVAAAARGELLPPLPEVPAPALDPVATQLPALSPSGKTLMDALDSTRVQLSLIEGAYRAAGLEGLLSDDPSAEPVDTSFIRLAADRRPRINTPNTFEPLAFRKTGLAWAPAAERWVRRRGPGARPGVPGSGGYASRPGQDRQQRQGRAE